MKKFLLPFLVVIVGFSTNAQRLLTWAPEFPQENNNLSFIIDCTKGNQGLLNFEGGNSSNVYMHVGVITNLSTGPSDWRYVKFVYGSTNPLANATALGANKYQYTLKDNSNNPVSVRTFFAVPASETIIKVNVIFRNASGNLKEVNSDLSDMYIPVYAAGQFNVRLNLPPFEPRYIPYAEPISVPLGGAVNITGVASNNAALTIKLNGNTVNTATGATSISANPTISTACDQKIMFEGNDGSGLKKDSFSFYIPSTQTIAPLPAGLVEGINYDPNNTSATLVLFAPNKTSVIIVGDFTNWVQSCANQMNKTPDGNYYWLTVNGLTPGIEYGFQYLVDNAIKIADPYTQKVLDPDNDLYISAVTYPNLKPYPTGLTTGLVGIIQTAEPQYTWVSNSFVKPDKKNLVTYELLIRDFTAEHSYQSLIDSLNYLKNTGINSIELMPINEFDGNESWGYNPSFYFAPDKYYGPKNKLKEFIDKCHQNGIAVILDVVYNHCTGNAPQAKLYWNNSTNQPAANNPWLNVTAPHPYSVFNDFNHTSTATKYLVQRSVNFWLDEYKVDGFRFDLAKGFTQTVTNTTTVENYDASRVANLKYYYDNAVPAHPNTYMILEFLGTMPSQEEQEYAAYGFMLWGNMNSRYNQCTMGFSSNSDISGVVYNSSQRNFNNPALMGYMESHDEERTMFKNLQFGNSSGTYDVKNLNTALAREEAAAAVFFTVPGPKLIWQFEERGFDISINSGGSNTANKPPHWEYMNNANRRHLYDTYKSMIDLRLNNPAIFNNTVFNYDFFNGGGLVKVFQIADPNAAGKKVTVVANLDVVQQTKSVTFQGTGDYTNYISNGIGTNLNGATGSIFTLSGTSQNIVLQPGEYHIYVSVPACTTPAPTTSNTTLTYCQNATATALTATGTNLLWYAAATGGTGSSTAPTLTTTTVGSTVYYVSQTSNSCEGPRLAITVNVTASTPSPTVSSPVIYCQNATAIAFTATGTNLLWYTNSTGGTGNSTAPTPSTTTVGSAIFYVSQTQSCGESPRAAITVNVNAIPTAPTVSSPINYCQNATATVLTATGNNLLWYNVSAGGTGSATAPTPLTTTVSSTTFYVSQTNNGCESPRAAITINVNVIPAAPTAASPVTYCQNATATALTATGSNLLWYAAATGGIGSTTAPTPSTTTIGSINYYVSQNANGCESPRTLITVTITSTTAAPTVTTSVTYCQNATAVTLTASGTNLLWYTNSTGGTGSLTAPTPSTTIVGTAIFYVSQTQSCGESPRASITVTVNVIPTAPTVSSPINYCQNATATVLTATGNNLLWYSVANGGTGSITAPTPSTTTVGSSAFYVSQTNNGCESPRAAITININITPSAPIVTGNVNYCQNATAMALTATGSNLLWYTVATGGTGSPTAPTPSTTTTGATTFYVSQTQGICESPRSAITVTVTALPAAPVVVSSVTYCQNATATALSATGTNLLWYTTATGTGGTASNTAPIPNTTVAGTLNYYVAQTNSCGEGARANIQVIITATRAAPITLSTTAITLNSATLNWNAQSGSFFTVEYKPAAAATWNVAATGIQTNSYNLSGLTIGSTYQWRITANCAAVGSGNVSSVQTFTTASRNNKITIIKDGIGLKISPNPVSTSAIIDYIVPGSGEVTFNIFDENGRSVKKFSDGIKVAGQYQKDLLKEFKGMAKGGYFIRLEQSSKSIGLHFVKF
jgi:glycosidase